jgi:hypothetical protein
MQRSWTFTGHHRLDKLFVVDLYPHQYQLRESISSTSTRPWASHQGWSMWRNSAAEMIHFRQQSNTEASDLFFRVGILHHEPSFVKNSNQWCLPSASICNGEGEGVWDNKSKTICNHGPLGARDPTNMVSVHKIPANCTSGTSRYLPGSNPWKFQPRWGSVQGITWRCQAPWLWWCLHWMIERGCGVSTGHTTEQSRTQTGTQSKAMGCKISRTAVANTWIKLLGKVLQHTRYRRVAESEKGLHCLSKTGIWWFRVWFCTKDSPKLQKSP